MIVKKFLLVLTLLVFLSVLLWGCAKEEVEIQHTLVFHTYNEEALEPVIVTPSGLLTTELPKPIKDGYDFVGWYTDEALKTLFEGIPANSEVIINLYAKYKPTVYSYNVSVKCDVEGSVRFSGGAVQQVITQDNPNFESVLISENVGYKYLYYKIGDTLYR